VVEYKKQIAVIGYYQINISHEKEIHRHGIACLNPCSISYYQLRAPTRNASSSSGSDKPLKFKPLIEN
jgi:hypothetical protein